MQEGLSGLFEAIGELVNGLKEEGGEGAGGMFEKIGDKLDLEDMLGGIADKFEDFSSFGQESMGFSPESTQMNVDAPDMTHMMN